MRHVALLAIAASSIACGDTAARRDADPLFQPPPPFDAGAIPEPSLFVTITGSDRSPCTRTEPCQSFDRAYQLAGPGDLVQIAGGHYRSQVLTPKLGAVDPHVILRAAPGEQVIVGDVGATRDCISVDGASYVRLMDMATPSTTVGGLDHQCGVAAGRNGSHHVDLLNIDAGHVLIGANDVRIVGGDYGPTVDDSTLFAPTNPDEQPTPPTNILIDGVAIHDVRRHAAAQIQCVALWNGDGVTIRNSRFDNCERFHISLLADKQDLIRNVIIEANLFEQSGPRPPETSSTIRIDDRGGLLDNIVVRDNRVPWDEIAILLGFEPTDGRGTVDVSNNIVGAPVLLGDGTECSGTYRPKPRVQITCAGNVVQ